MQRAHSKDPTGKLTVKNLRDVPVNLAAEKSGNKTCSNDENRCAILGKTDSTGRSEGCATVTVSVSPV